MSVSTASYKGGFIVYCEKEHREEIRKAIELEISNARNFLNSLREYKNKKSLEYAPCEIEEINDGFEFYCEEFDWTCMRNLQASINAIVRPDIRVEEFSCERKSSKNGDYILIKYKGTMWDNVAARIHQTVIDNSLYKDLFTYEHLSATKGIKNPTHCSEAKGADSRDVRSEGADSRDVRSEGADSRDVRSEGADADFNYYIIRFATVDEVLTPKSFRQIGRDFTTDEVISSVLADITRLARLLSK